MAQPFDPVRLKTTGEAVQVAEPVGLAPAWQARFTVSDNGLLVYQAANRVQQDLVAYDRNGARKEVIGPSAVYLSLALSPDERRLALSRSSAWPTPGIDIWLMDLVNGALSRFTFNRVPPPSSAVWAPSGDRVLFFPIDMGKPSFTRKVSRARTKRNRYRNSTAMHDLQTGCRMDGYFSRSTIQRLVGSLGSGVWRREETHSI